MGERSWYVGRFGRRTPRLLHRWTPPFEVPEEQRLVTGATFVKLPIADEVARSIPTIVAECETIARKILKVEEVRWAQTLVTCLAEPRTHPYASCSHREQIMTWDLIWVPVKDTLAYHELKAMERNFR